MCPDMSFLFMKFNNCSRGAYFIFDKSLPKELCIHCVSDTYNESVNPLNAPCTHTHTIPVLKSLMNSHLLDKSARLNIPFWIQFSQ